MEVRQLGLDDMNTAALVHRAAFDERLPWLAGLHTPEEDRAYFRGQVFNTCQTWGAFEGAKLVGILALRQTWIDQLYVLPGFQGLGAGTTLLNVAKTSSLLLQLWTFQKNTLARSFYEAQGFVSIKQTDGQDNEEHEPDVLYEWRTPGRS